MSALDSSIRQKNAGKPSPPVVVPVPGWLFFHETLPMTASASTATGVAGGGAGGTATGTASGVARKARAKLSAKEVARLVAERESLAQLSLESHAPLPLEHLAYGWVADDSALLYYATTREQLHQFCTETAAPLFLLPDFLLAPPPSIAGAWVWLATPEALTAVRFAKGAGTAAGGDAGAEAADRASVPEEIHSWSWPVSGAAGTENAAADAAKDSPPPTAETPGATQPDFDANAATGLPEDTPAADSSSTARNTGEAPVPLSAAASAAVVSNATAACNVAPASGSAPGVFPDPLAMRRWREAHEGNLPGAHEPGIFLWNGATLDRARQNFLAAHWTRIARDGGAVRQAATVFPVAAAWNADVRDRGWLARERKNRADLRRSGRLLRAAACAWLVLLGGVAVLQFQGRAVDAAATSRALRQNEVKVIQAREAMLTRLDDFQAGEISNPANSFFDALATLNHFRPQNILFTRATTTGKRDITITATANSVQDVSAYVAKLRAESTAFESIREKTSMNASATSFDLTVIVKDLSDVTRGSPFTQEEQELMRSLFAPPTATKPETPAKSATTPAAPETPDAPEAKVAAAIP